jgi:hypothetical protein
MYIRLYSRISTHTMIYYVCFLASVKNKTPICIEVELQKHQLGELKKMVLKNLGHEEWPETTTFCRALL